MLLEVNEVCNYLDDNNLTIQLRGTYDPQSGWHGEHVILEGRDLSGNGYCFGGKSLLNHVRNYKKYEMLKNSEEYQKHIELKKQIQRGRPIL